MDFDLVPDLITNLDLNMDSHLISILVSGQQEESYDRKGDNRCSRMIKGEKNPDKIAT